MEMFGEKKKNSYNNLSDNKIKSKVYARFGLVYFSSENLSHGTEIKQDGSSVPHIGV